MDNIDQSVSNALHHSPGGCIMNIHIQQKDRVLLNGFIRSSTTHISMK